jgi:hypothetical protein
MGLSHHLANSDYVISIALIGNTMGSSKTTLSVSGVRETDKNM